MYSRLVSVRGCQVDRCGTDADMSWPPPLVDRRLRRGLGRETELREPVLHVEVDPVARDNPVLDRRDVALAKAHTPARRGNGLAARPRHRAGIRPNDISLVDRRVADLVLVPLLPRVIRKRRAELAKVGGDMVAPGDSD